MRYGAICSRCFVPETSVLDLGCGTGEDAQQLGRAGVRVRAIDASPEMVRIARHRGVDAEVGNIEELEHLDGTFDGVISDFGALNCVEDLAAVAAFLWHGWFVPADILSSA